MEIIKASAAILALFMRRTSRVLILKRCKELTVRLHFPKSLGFYRHEAKPFEGNSEGARSTVAASFLCQLGGAGLARSLRKRRAHLWASPSKRKLNGLESDTRQTNPVWNNRTRSILRGPLHSRRPGRRLGWGFLGPSELLSSTIFCVPWPS